VLHAATHAPAAAQELTNCCVKNLPTGTHAARRMYCNLICSSFNMPRAPTCLLQYLRGCLPRLVDVLRGQLAQHRQPAPHVLPVRVEALPLLIQVNHVVERVSICKAAHHTGSGEWSTSLSLACCPVPTLLLYPITPTHTAPNQGTIATSLQLNKPLYCPPLHPPTLAGAVQHTCRHKLLVQPDARDHHIPKSTALAAQSTR
jgi:hypothetical protein